jgi:hypothetical protein
VKREPRRIFERKKKVAEIWRKLDNGRLHNVHLSNTRMIKSRRIRSVEHAARIETKINTYAVLVRKLGRDHMEDLSVHMRIICIKTDLKERGLQGVD